MTHYVTRDVRTSSDSVGSAISNIIAMNYDLLKHHRMDFQSNRVIDLMLSVAGVQYTMVFVKNRNFVLLYMS